MRASRPCTRCRELQIPKFNEIIEKLDPIIQATKLLQTKKTEEHIETIVEMCNKLRFVAPSPSFPPHLIFSRCPFDSLPWHNSDSQIIKILNLYTAGDEEVISNTFMKKITKHLSDKRKSRKCRRKCCRAAFASLLPTILYFLSQQRPAVPCCWTRSTTLP